MIKTVLAVSSAVLILSSCSSNSSEQIADKEVVDSISKKDSATVKLDEEKEFKIHTVLAAIPSPSHEAVVIVKSGYTFDETFMNDHLNVDKYTSSYKSAINYGVYSADLAYASSFMENKGVILKCFGATRKSAEKVGTLSVFDQITKSGHFEEVTNNPDSLEATIQNVYVATDEFLTTEHNLNVATKMLVGSIIENQYILMNTLLKQKGKQEAALQTKVWEAKIHLGNLASLLKEYEGDADFKELSDLSAKVETYLKQYEGIKTEKDFNKEKLTKMMAELKPIRDALVSI